MSKEHKIKLPIVYCQRCRASHPPDEHLAKPKKATEVVKQAKKAIGKPPPLVETMPALNALHDEMVANAADLSAVTPIMRGDGVAFTSMAHPTGPGPGRGHRIKKSSLETIEVEVPKHPHPRNADKPKKKRTKAEALALVEAEAARKRALKTARQTRWRNKQRKKAKKK